MYYENGSLKFKHFAPYEILPFWSDSDHTILDAAVRLYTLEEYRGIVKKAVEHVEIYKSDGVYRYIYDDKILKPDTYSGEYSPYLTVGENGYNWDKIPIIAFKRNKKEIPLISRVKSIQDGINDMLSDFQNNMQENPRNSLLVLKGYDGENLAEFRRNLAAYGSVKIKKEGGVDVLKVDTDAEKYNTILQLLHKALVENACGYDAKDERMSGDPNQMNIKAMLNDLDLDANNMETELQASFEELLWFIDIHFRNSGEHGLDLDKINIIFNRDGIVNESEIINDCLKSQGLLSQETIVANHPWVAKVAEELAKLAKENEDEYDKIGKQEVQKADGTESEE
ncbi:hypothetical protein FACS1894120_6790 [Clostridia bacterium]|nr:hypothetical protein FACS1894120_6790 [Clostridia bacterium]